MATYFLPKTERRKYPGACGKRLIMHSLFPLLLPLSWVWEHMFMSGESMRKGLSPTNLNEGLSPDAGAHFEDGGGPLLQKTNTALERPAIHIGARL